MVLFGIIMALAYTSNDMSDTVLIINPLSLTVTLKNNTIPFDVQMPYSKETYDITLNTNIVFTQHSRLTLSLQTQNNRDFFY